MRRLAIVLALAACDRDVIESCDDRLDGVYTGDGKAWVVVDYRIAGKPRTLEAYPLFPDASSAADGLEVAPRVIDFAADLSGVVRRRYMRGAAGCTAKVPAKLTRCGADGLELVLAEPSPPTSFAPCTFGRTEPSRREKWRRE